MRFLNAKVNTGAAISVAFRLPNDSTVIVLDVKIGEPNWVITYRLQHETTVRYMHARCPRPNALYIATRRAEANPLPADTINRLPQSA